MNNKFTKMSILDGLKNKWVDIANPVFAVVLALIMGGLIVLVSGDNPLKAYYVLAEGAFGSLGGIINTIRFTIPIIFLAYSFSLCSRCGYFNISQESQLYSASIAMVVVSELTTGWNPYLRIVLIVVSACVCAAIACVIPAIIKFKLDVSEVVVGIMLNYLMALVTQHLLSTTSLGNPVSSMLVSQKINETVTPTTIFLIGILVVVSYWFLINKTVPGYQLGTIGKNPLFAKASGMPSLKVLLTSSLVAGALTGLVACGEILGYFHVLIENYATNMGFNGMTSALIGAQGPIGMVLGAILLGALKSGSVLLTVLTNTPSEIVDCVQGFVMFFATVAIFKKTNFGKNKKLKGAQK